MLTFPDRPVNLQQLNAELRALNLPGFRGASRLSRQQNEQGEWVRTPPVIVIDTDDLTPQQQSQVAAVVAAHVPAAPPAEPTYYSEAELLELVADALTINQIKGVLSVLVRGLGPIRK